ncbi:hypothetical protein [Azospira restricta]|uniref:hypothetical protein n=1 Tax=Azospira restricta TaxID=404405 RepID=UPI00193BEFC8|nr:hypothetical protein [Azospira restricta]
MRDLGNAGGSGGAAQNSGVRGLRIGRAGGERPGAGAAALRARLQRLGIERFAELHDDGDAIACRLAADAAHALLPGHDTLQLAERLAAGDGTDADPLEREIVVALLASPQEFAYPSHAEFAAAVGIRRNIAAAAAKTALCFDPRGIERPACCWTYREDTGFTLLPGQPLIPSLRKATQPDVSGKCYAFSCYRATEYVILLGIAEALQEFNPVLLRQLQRQWETRAIMSGRFHDTFLHEYGSMATPLPARYYVPGDRVWFRNPDAHSSDAPGYEGSWVIYLGGGLFSNFWQRDRPYTLAGKCIEVYHWRHAARRDDDGELQIDETVVEARVRQSLADPEASAAILAAMLRYRDPQGVYADGGCIDSTRECPRRICPGTADIVLPG